MSGNFSIDDYFDDDLKELDIICDMCDSGVKNMCPIILAMKRKRLYALRFYNEQKERFK